MIHAVFWYTGLVTNVGVRDDGCRELHDRSKRRATDERTWFIDFPHRAAVAGIPNHLHGDSVPSGRRFSRGGCAWGFVLSKGVHLAGARLMARQSSRLWMFRVTSRWTPYGDVRDAELFKDHAGAGLL
jgi:hypothetical protein